MGFPTPLVIQGLGFRVQGLGFGVWGSGFRAQGSEFGIEDWSWISLPP